MTAGNCAVNTCGVSFPVENKSGALLHLLQLEVRVSCFLTSLESSSRYLVWVFVGSRRRGNGGVLRTAMVCMSTESGPQPKPASWISLDFPLRSPTEIRGKKKNPLNLQLLTDWACSDAATRLLRSVRQSSRSYYLITLKYESLPICAEEGNEDLSQRGKEKQRAARVEYGSSVTPKKITERKKVQKCLKLW